MKNTGTDPESNSSNEQDSSSPSPTRFSVVCGIGVIGKPEDVREFADQFIAAIDEVAKKINDLVFDGRLQLLPVDEENVETH